MIAQKDHGENLERLLQKKAINGLQVNDDKIASKYMCSIDSIM